MQKTGILLSIGIFLFGCSGTKEVIKSDLVKSESQKKPIMSMMADIQGAVPNSVIVNTHWMDEKNLAIDFLIYKINSGTVFGAAINLAYDSEVLKYLSYKKGDFLEKAGQLAGSRKPIYLISAVGNKTKGKKPTKKRLVIGATLFRGTPGVIGSGKLLSLRFEAKKNKPTEITFTKKKLKNLKAQDIVGINWPVSIPVSPHNSGK